MKFNINEYINALDNKLAELDQARRVTFAIWCCLPLMDEFYPHLAMRIGDSQAAILKQSFVEVWKNAVLGNFEGNQVINTARSVCKSADWDQSKSSSNSEELDFGAEELIGGIELVFESYLENSSRAAAECAVRMINRVDYRIVMVLGERDAFSHPEMIAELGIQSKMVNFLQTQRSIVDGDQRRFRTLAVASRA